MAVTLNAPPTLTRDFLTVLSGIDEFLMTRLIRAQTADGVTVIEFLDDVMQDRTDGFKTHHRIAAAKELIVHIVRDEQPSQTPSPSTREGWGEGDSPVVGADPRVRPLPGSQTPSPSTGEGWGEGDSTAVGADPCVRPLPGSQTPSPSTGEGWGEGAPPPLPQGEGWGEGDSPVVPAQTEGNPDNSIVVPAKSLREPRGAAGPVTPQPTPLTLSPTRTVEPTHYKARRSREQRERIPEPSLCERLPRSTPGADTHSQNPDPAEGPERHRARRPRTRRTRTQRRRDGAAKAATLGKGPERNKEEKQDEKLQQHWHEPDPHSAPIDSTHSGRSPPW